MGCTLYIIFSKKILKFSRIFNLCCQNNNRWFTSSKVPIFNGILWVTIMILLNTNRDRSKKPESKNENKSSQPTGYRTKSIKRSGGFMSDRLDKWNDTIGRQKSMMVFRQQRSIDFLFSSFPPRLDFNDHAQFSSIYAVYCTLFVLFTNLTSQFITSWSSECHIFLFHQLFIHLKQFNWWISSFPANTRKLLNDSKLNICRRNEYDIPSVN